MKTLFTYLLIAMFSIGTLQASMNCCANMDMQDMQQEAPSNTSDDHKPCHSMGDEVAAEEETDDSCCGVGCDSCISAVVTFDSQPNKFGQTHAESFAQSVVFALPSNHEKIPTPPPNS